MGVKQMFIQTLQIAGLAEINVLMKKPVFKESVFFGKLKGMLIYLVFEKK